MCASSVGGISEADKGVTRERLSNNLRGNMDATRVATFIIATSLFVSGLFSQARSVKGPGIDDQLAEIFDNIYQTSNTIDEKVYEAERASAGQKPSDVIIEQTQVEKFVSHLPGQSRIPPILGSAVANSDLIVMGTPLTARSLPIKSRTFLFTEYSVRVDRVFFDSSHTVSVGDTIIVCREGGTIVVGQVTVHAVEPSFDQFSLNQQYLFGLIPIKQTGTYLATALRTFVLKDSLVSPASKLESSNELHSSLRDFTSDVDAAVAQRKMREGKGEK
jgi:hypothetical protein